jgi:hypothetical protein
MIVTLCTFAASVAGAALAAYKINSSKTEKVIFLRKENITMGKECSALSKVLVDELTRMQSATLINPTDLDFVTKALESMVRTTWDKKGYYYNDYIVPFINVLRASRSLERDNPSLEYLTELKATIAHVGASCSEAMIRGETGEINSFTYDFMHNCLQSATARLERLNRKRINSF